MNSHTLAAAVDIRIIITYFVLVMIYLIILKLLLNALQQLTKEARTQKSIIDLEIHRGSPIEHVEDSMRDMHVFQATVAFLRVLVAFMGLVGIMVILIVKLNFLVAILIVGASGLIVWQAIQWRRSKKLDPRWQQYFDMFLAGGGNVITIALLVIALVCVTVGLLVLPV